jgi:hypothetical protein
MDASGSTDSVIERVDLCEVCTSHALQSLIGSVIPAHNHAAAKALLNNLKDKSRPVALPACLEVATR